MPFGFGRSSASYQGDQIGHIFADWANFSQIGEFFSDWANLLSIRRIFTDLANFFHWAIAFYLSRVFLITEGAQIFGLLFSSDKAMCSFRQKTAVAIIVAIFSQTHLVTLLAIVTRSYFCNA
jgi:hypothetical protein